jgi:hypothetical protein
MGFAKLGKMVVSTTKGGKVMLCGTILLLGLQISTNFADRDESNNYAVRDFGNALLNGLPKDSILLCYGDLPGNAARYGALPSLAASPP